MAAAVSSAATSKLLNLRNPALHNLIRRHLLHPAASAAARPTLRSLDNVSNGSPENSPISENSNLHVSDFALNLRLPFGLPLMQIETARSYVPSAGPEDDDDLEDDDDGDGFGDFDDEADEGDYSGSDYDDDDNFNDGDEDGRPPSRGYRK